MNTREISFYECNIIDDYVDSTLTVVEIRNKYGLSAKDLKKIRTKYNIPPRFPKLDEEEKETIKISYETGSSITLIGKMINRNRGVVYGFLKREGYDLSIVGALKKNLDKAKELYKNGVSLKGIAKELNLSENYIGAALYQYIDGDRRINLDKETKENILTELKESMITQKEIAEKYNVSTAIVSIIKNSQGN